MAGGHMKYRHLSRSSAHRQALLRNMVTSLFKHESISTTWHKAKETQRLAEKLVTLGKKNTQASRRRAHQIFYEPNKMVPILFGPIRERYQDRPGGYTRVLRIEPIKEDQAESAILELVDGPKDMRLAMTAKTIARMTEAEPGVSDNGEEITEWVAKGKLNEITATNIKKATQFRKNGLSELEQMVLRMRELNTEQEKDPPVIDKKKVYPEERHQKELGYQ